MDVHLIYTGAGMKVNTLSHQRIFIRPIWLSSSLLVTPARQTAYKYYN